MSKPLLLLVDDDPAVLSALEAELTSEFGSIIRVAAFESPRAVLDSLPRWHEEHRTIALAVVDQRMPEMSGVELISALRDSVRSADARTAAGGPQGSSDPIPFHPARHMRAALLTGYAGLESALAARNEAEVDRYFEKPWVSRTLHAMVRKLLSIHLRDAGQDRYLEFRELHSVDEIRRFLSMRFEVYAASPSLRYLLPEYSRNRLDIDAYDTQSRFFAVFAVGPDGTEQVGGLRLIGVSDPTTQRSIVFLASQDDALRTRAAAPARYPIELPEKWPDPEAIVRMLDLFRARGEGVVEASRLVVTAGHRGQSLGLGQVVLGLHEGATTFVLEVLGVDNVLQSCTQKHQAASTRLGFRVAEGTAPTWTRRMQDTTVVLHGRESYLTDAARERVRSLGRGVHTRGAACRCAALAQCISGPYASGDFTRTDVFCPRAAQELLAARANPNSVPAELEGSV